MLLVQLSVNCWSPEETLHRGVAWIVSHAEVAEGLKQLAEGETPQLATRLERSRCTRCGRMLPEKDGVCDKCGASDFKRRADDNEESLRTRLMAYYKQTSPLVGYYYAKGDLRSVDGLASMDAVAESIAKALR